MTLPVTLHIHRSMWVSAYDGMARQWAMRPMYVDAGSVQIHLTTREGIADLHVEAGPSANTMASVYRNGDMVQGMTVEVGQ